jgi:S1-C subfamily serine protease
MLFRFFPLKNIIRLQSSRSLSTSNNSESVPINSILKVYATIGSPNYAQPWQSKPLKDVTGSGFVIDGRRILTNAHVVADQKFVMVRRHGSASRVPARVLAVGHDCDLALLGIENDDADEFFLHSRSLQFSDDIPRLEDEVSVIGYPTGGDNISITRGVVSRVEPQQYAHGVTTLLSIQIDAAINPGNSGGPALEGGKVVGVAFQNLSGAENIGFVIPVPIIKRFISDVDRNQGNYKGFCSLGMLCQSLENSQLRSFKQLAAQQTGVLVSKVSKVSSADGIVLPGDVILSAEGHTLASDGSILFRDRERIPFDWLLSSKHAGDMFSLKVLRNGQEISLEVPLKIGTNFLTIVFVYLSFHLFLCSLNQLLVWSRLNNSTSFQNTLFLLALYLFV